LEILESKLKKEKKIQKIEKEIQAKLIEIDGIKKTSNQNERIQRDLQSTLQINMVEKQKFQKILEQVQSTKNKDLIDMQVKKFYILKQ
jgi:hypothetical protein